MSQRFILCFDAHRCDGLVWSVKQRNKWVSAKTVVVNVPIQTVYRGPDARQPKAFMEGCGIISGDQTRLMINSTR